MASIQKVEENKVIIHSNAKVNFGLSIIGKTSSDKHIIDTIILPVKDLYDVVIVERAEKDEVFESFYYQAGTHRLSPEHKVVKVLEDVKKKLGTSDHFKVTINKKIPLGAGVGGISSNITSVALAINVLCGNKIVRSELQDLVKVHSSDSIFFIDNVPSRVTGEGEAVYPLPKGLFHKIDIELVQIPITTSTKEVFDNLVLKSVEGHNSIVKVMKALEEDNFDNLKKALKNDLQDTAIKLQPKIREYMNKYRTDAEREILVMTGSGSNFLKVKEK